MNSASVGLAVEELLGLVVEVVELALEDRDHVPRDVLDDLGVVERTLFALALRRGRRLHRSKVAKPCRVSRITAWNGGFGASRAGRLPAVARFGSGSTWRPRGPSPVAFSVLVSAATSPRPWRACRGGLSRGRREGFAPLRLRAQSRHRPPRVRRRRPSRGLGARTPSQEGGARPAVGRLGGPRRTTGAVSRRSCSSAATIGGRLLRAGGGRDDLELAGDGSRRGSERDVAVLALRPGRRAWSAASRAR